jgi:hypothetical protein
MREKESDKEAGSEEFKIFRAAMKQIVSVQKIDVVKKLPKMFQERVPPSEPRKKRTAKKKSRSIDTEGTT